MNKTQAVSKLQQRVFYLPIDLPAEITWRTPIPSGTLTEISEKKTKPDGVIITRNWGVVNHNTFSLADIYPNRTRAKAALKQWYLDQVPVAEAVVTDCTVLAEAVDTIGIDPNPPEPEPIEPAIIIDT